MKSFQCQNCGQLLFFENTHCLRCSYSIGYLPKAGVLSALIGVEENRWQPLDPNANHLWVQLCQNYRQENVCNWLIPAESNEVY